MRACMTQTATFSSERTVELWYQGDLVGRAVRAHDSFVLEAANEELDQEVVHRHIHRFITACARLAA